MPEQNFDLIVIGAGPGGYVAAIRAAQLGFNVAVIEKRDTLGGVCLNEGCIPSKALLESSEQFAKVNHEFAEHGIEVLNATLKLDKMMARKEGIIKKLTGGISGLMKKNKITVISGQAALTGKEGELPKITVGEQHLWRRQLVEAAVEIRVLVVGAARQTDRP